MPTTRRAAAAAKDNDPEERKEEEVAVEKGTSRKPRQRKAPVKVKISSGKRRKVTEETPQPQPEEAPSASAAPPSSPPLPPSAGIFSTPVPEPITATTNRKSRRPRVEKKKKEPVPKAKEASPPTPPTEYKTPAPATRKNKRETALKLLGQKSFPDRLAWNSRHFGMPVTSTPRPAKEKVKVTEKDVETCFGFDVATEDESFGTLISPIGSGLTRNHIGFKALLDRYKEKDDDEEDDPEVRIDRDKIKKTYSNKKKSSHLDLFQNFRSGGSNVNVVPQGKSRKRRAPGKKGGHDSQDSDEEANKWFEQKNKEFEDVENMPLLVSGQSICIDGD